MPPKLYTTPLRGWPITAIHVQLTAFLKQKYPYNIKLLHIVLLCKKRMADLAEGWFLTDSSWSPNSAGFYHWRKDREASKQPWDPHSGYAEQFHSSDTTLCSVLWHQISWLCTVVPCLLAKT